MTQSQVVIIVLEKSNDFIYVSLLYIYNIIIYYDILYYMYI